MHKKNKKQTYRIGEGQDNLSVRQPYIAYDNGMNILLLKSIKHNIEISFNTRRSRGSEFKSYC